MAEENSEILQLRTDGFMSSRGSEELTYHFPDFTACFNGLAVVRVIKTIYEELQGGACARVALSERAASKSGVTPEFCGHVIAMLLAQRCLVKSASFCSQAQASELEIFLQGHSTNWESDIEQLSTTTIACITHSSEAARLSSALKLAGLKAASICAIDGDSTPEMIQTAVNSVHGAPVVAVWGFPYDLPLLKRINWTAVQAEVTCIYGYCAGGVGRVGPTTMGRNAPCLECVAFRHQSNAGQNAARAANSFVESVGPAVPLRWNSHPLLAQLALSAFAFELTRLVTSANSLTLGAYLEFDWMGQYTRRLLTRYPRCPTCSAKRAPPRFPWSIALPLPASETK